MRQPRTVREGYLGLFSLVGLVVFALLAFWLAGWEFGERTYTINVRFSSASGLKEGAAVNFRGVLAGRVARINPTSNLVEITLRINEAVRIPVGSTIEVTRYGLLGESAVEITPTTIAQKSLEKFSPVGSTCDPKVIICDKSEVDGQPGTQLFANLTRLTEVFADPVFLERLNKTIANVAELSEDLAKSSKTLDKNLTQISEQTVQAAKSISKTAQDASEVSRNLNIVLLENRQGINQTVTQTKQLMTSLNTVINENRANIYQSLTSVQKTSTNINQLVSELQSTVRLASKTLQSPLLQKSWQI